MIQSKRTVKIPAHLLGCYAEDIAKVLGVSLEVAIASKAKASARAAEIADELKTGHFCVRAE